MSFAEPRLPISTKEAWQGFVTRAVNRYFAPSPTGFRSLKSGLGYRPDIDGLRALAVLSVIFYHAEFTGFEGGLVGVDIFFVISGYLITSIIVGALETGRFSLAWFYERRIRRIIPAFLVMVGITLAASVAFFPPVELAQFGLSALAAAAFASNIFFFFNTDYFTGGDTKPLLHTWSLGVEEQFYILWPLMLLVCYRVGLKRGVGLLVAAVMVASLAYAQLAGNSAEAFYLPQSRAWELMLGAMLALGMVPEIKSSWLRNALGLMGFGLIAFAITRLSSNTYFALFPCLGAMLVIHTGRLGDTFVSKALNLRPCVFIGLISYSLYLWHWPMFTFAKNYLARPLRPSEALVLIGATAAIAIASWRYIEQPFRFGSIPSTVSRRKYLVGGLGALSLVACVGLALFISKGLPDRLSPKALQFYLAGRDVNPLQTDCLVVYGNRPAEAARCIVPRTETKRQYDILVWGDSHGDALFPAISMLSERYGLSARQVTKTACPPLVDIKRVNQRDIHIRIDGCAEFNDAILRELQAGPRPLLAVLVSRWTNLTSANHPILFDSRDKPLDTDTSRRVMFRGLSNTINTLNALGITVLLVGQAPEFPFHPNECFMRRAMYHGNAEDCLRQPREPAERKLSTSKAVLIDLANSRPHALYVGLDSLLCDSKVCWGQKENQPLYRNRDHLSRTGAHEIAQGFGEASQLRALFSAQQRKR